MDPRFKGRLVCASSAVQHNRYFMLIHVNHVCPYLLSLSLFPIAACYSFYDEVMLFICAKLCLQLPMAGLQDIEEDVSDDHEEDKAEKHVNI